MWMRSRAAALAAACVVSSTLFAQDSPESVYASLHRAAVAGNLNEMLSHATEARRKELAGQPGSAEIARLIAAMMPRSYSVASTTVSPDGATAQLRATGKGTFLGQSQELHGTVNFMLEKGAWKVDKWEWGDKPGEAPSRVQAKPVPVLDKPVALKPASPASPTPAGATRAAPRADCEIKPVMSDEDMARCGASPR